MIKKLTEFAQKHAHKQVDVDPTIFNDPLAMTTEWGPAKKGGASFKTHNIFQKFPGVIEFRAGFGAKLFFLVFMAVGVGALLFGLIPTIEKGNLGLNEDTLVSLGLMVFFGGTGLLLHYFGTSPIVFDRNRGYFWKGRKDPQKEFDKTKIKSFTELSEVYAIQLISEFVRGDKKSYYSYELNLVLKDGNRLNVVDHGSKDSIQADARTLAEFLKVPVWDGITSK